MKIDAATTFKRDASGRLALSEEYCDLSALEDDQLRELRSLMVGKHSDVLASFTKLGDDRYSTPEGNGLLRDMNYYGECIRRVEGEMQCRMITLD